MQPNAKVYMEQGGNKQVVANGGEIEIQEGGIVNKQAWVDVTITTAQILALNATPIEVLAAPGANLANIFEGAVIFYDYNSAAYGGIAAGEDLSIKYTDASGLEVAQIETTGFLDQTSDQTRYALPTTQASGDTSITPVANAALVLHLLTAEISTGDSPLLLRIFYRTIPTVLS